MCFDTTDARYKHEDTENVLPLFTQNICKTNNQYLKNKLSYHSHISNFQFGSANNNCPFEPSGYRSSVA
jgi:hypothetical protein